SQRSRALTCLLTAPCVTPSSCAAAVKLLVRAATAKARSAINGSSLSFIVRSRAAGPPTAAVPGLGGFSTQFHKSVQIFRLKLTDCGSSLRRARSAFAVSMRPDMTELSTTALPVDRRTITVNGREYALPHRPTVVICVDGFDPAYLEHGFKTGSLPTMQRFSRDGFVGFADCAMPGTTNTNNTSIVTGVPPADHGINGNYYLDADTGEEVMVTDARRLRCGTILAAASAAGALTAVVT